MPSLGSGNLLSGPWFLGGGRWYREEYDSFPNALGVAYSGASVVQGTQQEDLSSEPSAATNRAPCHWGGSRSVPVYTSLKSL